MSLFVCPPVCYQVGHCAAYASKNSCFLFFHYLVFNKKGDDDDSKEIESSAGNMDWIFSAQNTIFLIFFRINIYFALLAILSETLKTEKYDKLG